MDQIKRLLASLALWQRISLGLALAAALAGTVYLSRGSGTAGYQPLFRGLSAEESGTILERLKESAVEYRVRDEDSAILVPASRVAELRLQMAAAGLPKTGRIGFELFDRTSFGASEFAEHVNYRRALEGELERSVMALAEVEQARVHLTFAKDSVFLESRQPAKGSVLVKIRPGATLGQKNVSAIAHLVASAVEGLAAEDVSVVDMQGNLLSKRRQPGDEEAEQNDAMIEFRRKLERDLLQKVTATLEPLLGPEHFRAGVTVECDFTSGEQSEETYDPARSVMTTSQRSEETGGSSPVGGVPGTPSALPRPLPRPALGGSGPLVRRTENIAYQSSRLVKRTKLPQGTLRRLSLSVLVDHRTRWVTEGGKAKRVVEPLPPESLKSIRDLVAGATGVVTERGDQVVIESLAFESTVQSAEPTAAPAEPPKAPSDPAAEWMRANKLVVIGAAVGLVVLLAAGVGLVLRMRKKKPVAVVAGPAALEAGPTNEPSQEAGSLPPAAVAGELPAPEEAMPSAAELRERELAEAVEQLRIPVGKTKKSEALTRHLAAEAGRDPHMIAQTLRTWLQEAKE